MPVPVKKNATWIYYMALVDQADTRKFKSSPTLAAGDFKNTLDGAAFANLGTLPTVTPSGTSVKVTVANTENNGDNFMVVSIDAAGAEWCDRADNFQTSVRQIDDLAFPLTSGRGELIDANGRVDVIAINGTNQTARDIGASVLLSTGTGTGQLDFTAGVVKGNLAQILGTALTETAGQIAAAFKKFFDKGTPTGTINSIPDAVAGATGGLFIAGTNAATTITTALTTTFTGNLTGSVASVTGAVGSVTGAVGSVTGAVGSVTGSVGSVTGNVGGNVVGTVASVVGAVGSVTGNVGGNVVGTVASVVGAVGSVTGAVGSVTGNVGGNVTGTIGGLTAAALADFFDTDSTKVFADAVAGSVVKETATGAGGSSPAAIADAVWDELIAGHLGAGSTGAALNAAGSAGNPWIEALPGAYVAGQAGYILGHNVDAQVSAVPTAVLAGAAAAPIAANVKKVTDIVITGTGTTLDPWNPV